ncbi:hypothetical protein TSUD_117880 [Trifolium subterraneum]|nr:hypothetical protein TSUD_117880 [Trifolium subterraneum]
MKLLTKFNIPKHSRRVKHSSKRKLVRSNPRHKHSQKKINSFFMAIPPGKTANYFEEPQGRTECFLGGCRKWLPEFEVIFTFAVKLVTYLQL